MPTHVALLRGINVGGGGKVPMAELRQLVTSLGHSEGSTYIQTGNVLFTPAHGDALALAGELEAAIAASFSVRSPVIVLTRGELAGVISASPYAGEPNPRLVHAVFLPADPDEAAHQRVADTVALVASNGSRDEAVILGRALDLHTPDGIGN